MVVNENLKFAAFLFLGCLPVGSVCLALSNGWISWSLPRNPDSSYINFDRMYRQQCSCRGFWPTLDDYLAGVYTAFATVHCSRLLKVENCVRREISARAFTCGVFTVAVIGWSSSISGHGLALAMYFRITS